MNIRKSAFAIAATLLLALSFATGSAGAAKPEVLVIDANCDGQDVTFEAGPGMAAHVVDGSAVIIPRIFGWEMLDNAGNVVYHAENPASPSKDDPTHDGKKVGLQDQLVACIYADDLPGTQQEVADYLGLDLATYGPFTARHVILVQMTPLGGQP